MLLWILLLCSFVCRCNLSEKHTVSILRAEVTKLGSGEGRLKEWASQRKGIGRKVLANRESPSRSESVTGREQRKKAGKKHLFFRPHQWESCSW
jgi:hypothetical protein